MSHSKPVDFSTGVTAKNGRTPVEPPIALVRPDNATLRKGQYHTYKLRTNPTSASSSTYELDVPLFSTGTVEEWLRFRNNLGRVIKGQNATGAAARCALARRSLESEALATFNNQAATGTETVDAFEICLDKVGNLIFPKRALQLQKRYMRRSPRKPGTMKTRTYVSRVLELNNYLPLFPKLAEGVAPTKLADDEIKDLLEFGMPRSYQRAMVLQGFDPMIHTVTEFIEFCERLEAVESYDAPNTSTKSTANNNKSGKASTKRKREGTNASSVVSEGNNYFCLLHGENPTHNTDSCFALKNSVKKMKAGTDSTKNKSGTNNNHSKDLHTMISAAVESALKGTGTGSRKRKDRKSKSDTAINQEEIKQFEQLSLSGGSSYRDDTESSVSSQETNA